MKKKELKRYILPAAACLVVLFGLAYYYLFTSFTGRSTTEYVYIDRDDNFDSLLAKVEPIAQPHCYHAFCALARHSGLTKSVRTGRYEVRPGMGALVVFRHLKNGMQTPLSLTIPSVRTVEDLAGELGEKLMVDSTELVKAFTDEAVCHQYGYTKETLPALFIPNTYDIYWNVSVDAFLKRMVKENHNFWNTDRMSKATALHIDPIQVTTLASIVDEETANNAEKPMIAGMYYNRLMLRSAKYPQGMPLQADPTIKFAWKQFGLRRIYNNLLHINSPYNTYRFPGLPPGPIRIASVAGIDAVLNLKHHPYLYMCAKEDFSGTHRFARTYEEHMANAKRYAQALNARGIK